MYKNRICMQGSLYENISPKEIGCFLPYICLASNTRSAAVIHQLMVFPCTLEPQVFQFDFRPCLLRGLPRFWRTFFPLKCLTSLAALSVYTPPKLPHHAFLSSTFAAEERGHGGPDPTLRCDFLLSVITLALTALLQFITV